MTEPFGSDRSIGLPTQTSVRLYLKHDWLWLRAGIVQKGDEIPCPVDADGRLTEPVTDFVGEYVKDADRAIIAKLKGEGRIVNVATEHHSYPFCWRSDTPLIYKVQVRHQLCGCPQAFETT